MMRDAPQSPGGVDREETQVTPGYRDGVRNRHKAQLVLLPLTTLSAASYALSHLHSWLGGLAGVAAIGLAAEFGRLVWLRVTGPHLLPPEQQPAPRVEIPNLRQARITVAPGDDGGTDLTWTLEGRRYVATLSRDEMPAALEALDQSAMKSEREGLVRVDLSAVFEQAIGRNPFRERPARRFTRSRASRSSSVQRR
jgi:hypothetical protein